MKLEPGAHVTPNVKLLRPLGEGGMGAVWVAEHTALGTEVAVKFLQGGYADDPSARARFSQEAAAASQVKSSHVVKIYDYGLTDTNVPFIVMELLEGTDLSKRIEAEKTIPPGALVPIVTQLCKALGRAHERNVIHRDVKPENVFLTQEGGETFVKLLDFGVAKTSQVSALSASGRRSTLAGESLGTPFYMSPEQFKNSKSIDHRSDLWSVGVLAYEALTGVLPFTADTVGALAIVVNDASPVPPSKANPNLTPTFDGWFAKACARDPAARFQSAKELSDALVAVFGADVSSRAIDSGSYRRIVISQLEPHEVADVERMSMRDTSFATSGGSATPAKGHGKLYAIGAVAAVSLAGVIAFVATQRHDQPRTPTTATSAAPVAVESSHDSATATGASARPAPPPPIASAPEPEAPAVSAAKTRAHATSSTAAPTPSGTKGKNERDIW